MNTTGIVGYIALLIILGSALGGGNETSLIHATRADAFSSLSNTSIPAYSEIAMSELVTPIGTISRFNQGENQYPGQSRYVRFVMDGITYEGTLHVRAD